MKLNACENQGLFRILRIEYTGRVNNVHCEGTSEVWAGDFKEYYAETENELVWDHREDQQREVTIDIYIT